MVLFEHVDLNLVISLLIGALNEPANTQHICKLGVTFVFV